MVSVNEQMGQESGEKKDFFRIWADKAIEITKETSAEKYREFYDEWMRLHQNTSGKLYWIQMEKWIFDSPGQADEAYRQKKESQDKGARYET